MIVLRKIFFSLSLKADLKDIKTIEYSALILMSNFIFEEEMIRAVMRFKLDKTLNIDNLLN